MASKQSLSICRGIAGFSPETSRDFIRWLGDPDAEEENAQSQLLISSTLREGFRAVCLCLLRVWPQQYIIAGKRQLDRSDLSVGGQVGLGSPQELSHQDGLRLEWLKHSSPALAGPQHRTAGKNPCGEQEEEREIST